jgi:hypothetical protein
LTSLQLVVITVHQAALYGKKIIVTPAVPLVTCLLLKISVQVGLHCDISKVILSCTKEQYNEHLIKLELFWVTDDEHHNLAGFSIAFFQVCYYLYYDGPYILLETD